MEKTLLQDLGILFLNLEYVRCPKFDHMACLRTIGTCGHHDDSFHTCCPKVECYHFVQWLRGRLGLPRDLTFIHVDRVQRLSDFFLRFCTFRIVL